MESTLTDPEETEFPLDVLNPGSDQEKKMPRGRRPKATPPRKSLSARKL